MKESMRSRTPPWPGTIWLESLTCASRFITDSTRSDNCATIPMITPRISACVPFIIAIPEKISAAIRQAIKPAIAPSQLLLGEILGTILLKIHERI
ncbi:hypothetical protein A2310_04120 [candidate division WOR-1 bacterium RIFOXYB2_FULL_37_13]|uniref:Uncharacterized protein n=1 Tax=candidate division WOR-1 bacterium RIFOXYB2_FULL_37_13 TaxID=1802579 RepID=A0A1F4STL6_UNCSA|nr:MAG: hypothetical protein A2310_04120 [candidate division WOR-1 bacterium RIFOXYB2_FULL_37_13]